MTSVKTQMCRLTLSVQEIFLSKTVRHTEFRKRIREYRHSVRDLVIRQKIRIFQCSRNVGSAKGKTAAMAVIGVESVTEEE